jgi:hypothetical protein
MRHARCLPYPCALGISSVSLSCPACWEESSCPIPACRERRSAFNGLLGMALVALRREWPMGEPLKAAVRGLRRSWMKGWRRMVRASPLFVLFSKEPCPEVWTKLDWIHAIFVHTCGQFIERVARVQMAPLCPRAASAGLSIWSNVPGCPWLRPRS